MQNTKYPESIAKSKEYLDTALEKITKAQLPYNPISYLMWYEYAKGEDEQLKRSLELLLKQNNPIDFDQITRLHKKHMGANKLELAEQTSRELQNILTEMVTQLSASSSGIENRGNTLNTYADELNKAASLDIITKIAKNIITETKSVVQSSKALKNQLDSAQSKINVLTQELEGVKKTAQTDSLTTLLNRHGFDENMAKIMEGKDNFHEPLSVIMLDIDHFKKFNDQYGHLVGDNVLKMLGKHLKNHIKGQDIAARFGGEEFILVLPKTPIKGAYLLAQQIRLGVADMKLKIKDTGEPIDQITISLGVALLKSDESLDAAIKRADDALYRAKNQGRNRAVTESEDDN